MKRAATALLLACVGVGVLAACSRGSIQPGDARLAFDRARVQVGTDGGALQSVKGGRSLDAGDRVKVLQGDAELRLARGARLLLREGSDVLVGRAPILRAGEVVAEVDDTPLTVRSSGSSVEVQDGVTRIRAGLALTAGVYSGSSRVRTADRALRVPAYRQVSVLAFGVLPAAPAPLEYRDTDRWDLRYLGPAIDIGNELQRRSDGFSAQLRPNEGVTPGFFEILLPDLPSGSLESCQAALDGSFGEGRRPGEVLVGASLALQGRSAGFTDRCRRGFAFRDDGATWGLVALDLGARSLPRIRNDLVAAIGRLPSESTITALGALSPRVDDGGPPAVTAAPSSPPPAPTTATPAPAPAPTPAPAPVPLPEPVQPLLPPLVPAPEDPSDGLLAPVGQLVEGLLGGLLG